MQTDVTMAGLQTALGPTYKKLTKFRAGGMSRLYTAHDALLNRDIVIKVLGSVDEDPARAAKRFSREAQVAAKLNHANIVPIYFAGQYPAGGKLQLFFAMKKIVGQPLDSLPAVDPTEAIRILRDLAWALDHAHAAGVYHRDIKPSNIILEGHTRTPILVDFGIAAVEGHMGLTQEGTRLGTRNYMSPEQLRGVNTKDPRVDIYALGEVGYRLLTGEDPFVEEQYIDFLGLKHRWSGNELASAAPNSSQRLVGSINKCMEWEPANRYQTAAAFARDLDSMMPKITPQALLDIKLSGGIDTDFWARMGIEAGFLEPPTTETQMLSLFFLHSWLSEFGYSSISQLRERLNELSASAPAILREFVHSCECDDPPYAVGMDVIRIVLGIAHGATVHFPHLSSPDGRITRQINRFLQKRRNPVARHPFADIDGDAGGGT